MIPINKNTKLSSHMTSMYINDIPLVLVAHWLMFPLQSSPVACDQGQPLPALHEKHVQFAFISIYNVIMFQI